MERAWETRWDRRRSTASRRKGIRAVTFFRPGPNKRPFDHGHTHWHNSQARKNKKVSTQGLPTIDRAYLVYLCIYVYPIPKYIKSLKLITSECERTQCPTSGPQ